MNSLKENLLKMISRNRICLNPGSSVRAKDLNNGVNVIFQLVFKDLQLLLSSSLPSKSRMVFKFCWSFYRLVTLH